MSQLGNYPALRPNVQRPPTGPLPANDLALHGAEARAAGLPGLDASFQAVGGLQGGMPTGQVISPADLSFLGGLHAPAPQTPLPAQPRAAAPAAAPPRAAAQPANVDPYMLQAQARSQGQGNLDPYFLRAQAQSQQPVQQQGQGGGGNALLQALYAGR